MSHGLRQSVLTLFAVLAEIGLYHSYRGHDARFHWFTHFFVGATVVLLIGALYTWRTGRPVRLPLVWILGAHAFAMFPDFLFQAGVAHYRWMDLFLGHISTHFVPGRNLLFLTLAGALASRRGIPVLVGGMCETDYSGYPDCRAATMAAQAETLRLGLDVPMQIDTPLMYIDKAGTWALADELGGQSLVDLIAEDTHTCYLGERGQRHDWGYGCGECPACELRAKGWERWKTGA